MKEENYNERICNYSGLLSVEQYQWVEEETDKVSEQEHKE